jgi:tRNA (guanine-N7-)-methyltransferase
LTDRLIRSYGRIKSRRLSEHKQFLYDNLLPEYEIKTPEANLNLEHQETYLEIGFGFGDFAYQMAKANPQINYLACETHINGIINLLAKLETAPAKNIKIFQSDIRLLLDKISPDFLSRIYILFPDPWPKNKHHKRRLINRQFLQLLASKMPQDGELIIATDHLLYRAWIIQELLACTEFEWQAKSKSDWQNFPADWTITKYQKKALADGRQSVILKARRR